MQRRKANAYIASPVATPGSPTEEKPLSRWNQKSLGVTNRIWLILASFLAIVAFTRYITPENTVVQGNRHVVIASNLKPKNYLNTTRAAEGTVPFDFCPVFGPGDDLAQKYGSLQLSRTRLHLGSNARVQRVIHKALLGLPVTISVVGGSVSACHGAGDDPLSPDCYPSRFFHWWNNVFPHSASEITNGAMRRINSAYFGFCAAHHIPDITDLVIVELDSDDDDDSIDNFELLVRSLLLRKEQPAVIVLGHFSPQVQETYGFAGPEHWHSIVAQFYDVPHISTKPLIYPDYIADPSSTSHLYVDPVLASPAGHEYLADVLISYMQSQVCAAYNAALGKNQDALPLLAADSVNVRQPTDARGLFGGVGQRKGAGAAQDGEGAPVSEEDENAPDNKGNALAMNALTAHMLIPPSRINTRPAELSGATGRTFEEIAPFCASANDLVNPLPPSIFAGTGWTSAHPPLGSTGDWRVSAHYWVSTLPTSQLRIPIQVGNGDIGIYFLRETQAAVGDGSAVECWVDDNVPGRRTIRNVGPVGEATPTLTFIDHYVARGPHYVECVLMGEEGQSVPPFRIMGIFAN
ncbi:hypothetical protein PUNSTDRAFT_96689 [Punctularia strigosozonata HHB-11173 SS5]|uniref:uncharacterized protein n=1 Tax=Punctularia strigosozonata (strain HHB-11173) TaxID=741275 RepID=UPI0004417924|nr:uncharacterized protein PUNSTDRAFT_96689 [Punctularia strigosozonata HHB-11173 SS5]EIN14668.1 hypothetical protein PUNSTDRAFT_96689 [Punctularia strigosozonata HHB-11173 SS5]